MNCIIRKKSVNILLHLYILAISPFNNILLSLYFSVTFSIFVLVLKNIPIIKEINPPCINYSFN